MRRFTVLGLLLLLAGCGFNTWWNPPFTTGFNPNRPGGDGPNVRRVMGEAEEVAPLNPEPGDIWPGPVKPEMTLRELQQQGTLGTQPPLPALGTPARENGAGPGSPPAGNPPSPPPQRPRGSSMPPPTSQPALNTPPPTAPTTAARPAAPVSRELRGQVAPTTGGAGVVTGGTSGYQTMALPGGGSAIVVPNGNGTSTLIKPDGTIETIPTPR